MKKSIKILNIISIIIITFLFVFSAFVSSFKKVTTDEYIENQIENLDILSLKIKDKKEEVDIEKVALKSFSELEMLKIDVSNLIRKDEFTNYFKDYFKKLEYYVLKGEFPQVDDKLSKSLKQVINNEIDSYGKMTINKDVYTKELNKKVDIYLLNITNKMLSKFEFKNYSIIRSLYNLDLKAIYIILAIIVILSLIINKIFTKPLGISLTVSGFITLLTYLFKNLIINFISTNYIKADEVLNPIYKDYFNHLLKSSLIYLGVGILLLVLNYLFKRINFVDNSSKNKIDYIKKQIS